MTRARVGTAVARQAGNAAFADATAALNSSAVVNGSRDTTSCVAWKSSTRVCVSGVEGGGGLGWGWGGGDVSVSNVSKVLSTLMSSWKVAIAVIIQ